MIDTVLLYSLFLFRLGADEKWSIVCLTESQHGRFGEGFIGRAPFEFWNTHRLLNWFYKPDFQLTG